MKFHSLDIVPLRANTRDDPLDILGFAAAEARQSPVALCTLIDIRGGSARALGAHLVVAADGRFCGYVSGGCVEAALASEALAVMEEGRDRTVMFGEGSPFFDLVLPCGGGITVAIHLLRNTDVLDHVLDSLARREPAAIDYDIERGTLQAARVVPGRTLIEAGRITMVYRPKTRLVLSGQAGEADALAKLGDAAGYDVVSVKARGDEIDDSIDAYTAVVLLHHDIDAEDVVLAAALRSKAFYIGALGSTRTHKRRLDRLTEKGVSKMLSQRIRAPIGIFGPTRDSVSLAISVLADISAARLEKHGA